MSLYAFGLNLSIPQHAHRESSNPRHEGFCDCGWRMPQSGLKRSPVFECKLTEEFSNGHDVAALNVLAGRRADAGAVEYGHSFPRDDRDLLQEAREELLDARNYLVWALERIHRGIDPSEHRAQPLQRALSSVISAFEDLRQAA